MHLFNILKRICNKKANFYFFKNPIKITQNFSQSYCRFNSLVNWEVWNHLFVQLSLRLLQWALSNKRSKRLYWCMRSCWALGRYFCANPSFIVRIICQFTSNFFHRRGGHEWRSYITVAWNKRQGSSRKCRRPLIHIDYSLKHLSIII